MANVYTFTKETNGNVTLKNNGSVVKIFESDCNLTPYPYTATGITISSGIKVNDVTVNYTDIDWAACSPYVDPMTITDRNDAMLAMQNNYFFNGAGGGGFVDLTGQNYVICQTVNTGDLAADAITNAANLAAAVLAADALGVSSEMALCTVRLMPGYYGDYVMPALGSGTITLDGGDKNSIIIYSIDISANHTNLVYLDNLYISILNHSGDEAQNFKCNSCRIQDMTQLSLQEGTAFTDCYISTELCNNNTCEATFTRCELNNNICDNGGTCSSNFTDCKMTTLTNTSGYFDGIWTNCQIEGNVTADFDGTYYNCVFNGTITSYTGFGGTFVGGSVAVLISTALTPISATFKGVLLASISSSLGFIDTQIQNCTVDSAATFISDCLVLNSTFDGKVINTGAANTCVAITDNDSGWVFHATL